MAYAYRTISDDADCVIPSMLFINILVADERLRIYERWSKNPGNSARFRDEERPHTKVEDWVNRHHGGVHFNRTQILFGHGCFRAFLREFKLENNIQVAPIVFRFERTRYMSFFQYPRFDLSHQSWQLSHLKNWLDIC